MASTISFLITILSPPAGVDFGLQEGHGTAYKTIQKQRSQGNDLHFEFTLTAPNWRGPIVQGKTDDKFVYIDIGTCAGQLETIWSRRLKISLSIINSTLIARYLKNPEAKLQVIIPGTAKDGGPCCGSIKPFPGWHII